MVQFCAVIGEHRTDRDVLLVIGEDGQYYAWDLKTDTTEPVELDENWMLDRAVTAASALAECHAVGAVAV